MSIFQRSAPSLPTQAAQQSAACTRRASHRRCTVAVALLCGGISLGAASVAHAKPFEEYIKPATPVAPLSSATWGAAGVIPRDISNGIESAKGAGVHPDWYYWDGEIIKAKDGKYHMFMCTFGANTSFNPGWTNSDAYHAVSQTNVLGPYARQDYVYNSGGSTPHKGHNVSAAELSDGSYVVVVSEIVPFQLYKSTSLDGPWTGCSPAPQSDLGGSNVSFVQRHDGKFEITARSGGLAISDTLCGHYVSQQPKTNYTTRGNGSIYPAHTSIPGVSNPSFAYEEDPHIWRSGGTYHIIYSGSGDRVGWHVYSPDGLTGWKDNGYAWSPRDYQKIFCYDGSTHCDAWYKMERPGVVLEDGHPTHITWAVADVDKDNSVTAGSNHGTKVVVVPFDGVAFDNDFGTGGGAGAGGTTGTGGATGTAGNTGTGGARGGTTAATGGSTSRGGSTITGGAGGSVAGGVTGSTSSTATGGSTSSAISGGAGANGGTTSSAAGGSSSRGGSVSTSGGGSSASGGAKTSASTSASSGGSPSSSSSGSAEGGNGGSSTVNSPASTASAAGDSGCSCAMGSTSRGSALGPGLLLAALGMLLAKRRNRGRRTPREDRG